MNNSNDYEKSMSSKWKTLEKKEGKRIIYGKIRQK